MEFIVTFGQGQYDGKYKNSFFVIHAENKRAAQEEAKSIFKDSYSMLYESREAAGVDEYGLTEVCT